jgi:hypothetical protein
MEDARCEALEAACLGESLWTFPPPQDGCDERVHAVKEAARHAIRAAEIRAGPLGCQEAAWSHRQLQTGFLRDIFGNPFQPVPFNLAWRTPDIVSLAHAAYDERILPSGELDHQRLAVLADALLDAGCTSVDVLDHLRGPGPHVRGCWLVDAILDKR